MLTWITVLVVSLAAISCQDPSDFQGGKLVRLLQPNGLQVFYYNPAQTANEEKLTDNPGDDDEQVQLDKDVKRINGTNAEREELDESLEGNQEGKPSKLRQEGETGFYFLYHPSGSLQKVEYSNRDDAENMVFSARLRYKNVEPINGPIYTYDPQTYVFRRL